MAKENRLLYRIIVELKKQNLVKTKKESRNMTMDNKQKNTKL